MLLLMMVMVRVRMITMVMFNMKHDQDGTVNSTQKQGAAEPASHLIVSVPPGHVRVNRRRRKYETDIHNAKPP